MRDQDLRATSTLGHRRATDARAGSRETCVIWQWGISVIDEQLTLEPSSYGWRVAREEDGSMGLYLTSSDGEESGPYGPR
jgi:hypothetical protein